MFEELKNEVLELKDEMIALRQDFHQHPEVGLDVARSAGIVACREDDASLRLVFANQVRDCRCREKPVLTDKDFSYSVCGSHLEDGLNGFAVIKAAVASQYEDASLESRNNIKYRLNEIFEIVRLLECSDFLSQPRGSGSLVIEGGCSNAAHDIFPIVSVDGIFHHINTLLSAIIVEVTIKSCSAPRFSKLFRGDNMPEYLIFDQLSLDQF